MRIVQQVNQSDVWNHWRLVEGFTTDDFRADIRGALPRDLVWSLCEVQPEDINRLFIISSDDWSNISGGTFRVTDVAARMDLPSNNKHTIQIATDIGKKEEHLKSGGQLDTKLIAITENHSPSGRFTFIEGNRRSVAFLRQGSLIGISIFVGYSPSVVNCVWARHSY